jgi:hypothetical protein
MVRDDRPTRESAQYLNLAKHAKLKTHRGKMVRDDGIEPPTHSV